jgi:hypothetical protein
MTSRSRKNQLLPVNKVLLGSAWRTVEILKRPKHARPTNRQARLWPRHACSWKIPVRRHRRPLAPGKSIYVEVQATRSRTRAIGTEPMARAREGFRQLSAGHPAADGVGVDETGSVRLIVDPRRPTIGAARKRRYPDVWITQRAVT